MSFLKTRIVPKPWMLPSFLGYAIGALLPLNGFMQFLLYFTAPGENPNPFTSPGWVCAVFGLIGFGTGLLLWRASGWIRRRRFGLIKILLAWSAAFVLVSVEIVGVAVLYGSYIGMPILDEVMLVNFWRHESSFERLSAIYETRSPSKGGYSLDLANSRLPAALSNRDGNESFGLLAGLGIRTADASAKDGLALVAWSDSLWLSDDTETKGFVYLAHPPADLKSSLNSYGYSELKSYRRFRHIRGNWYLYYDHRVDHDDEPNHGPVPD